MQNVKRNFSDKQANFTIQNYLTWHYIDAILLAYFKNEDRFNKFKSCAVTDLDMIFVDALEKMLKCVSEYSMDEIRYMYFVNTIPKLLPHFYFYKTTKEETEKILDKIVETKNGVNSVPIEALYASQMVFQRNFLMRMHVQNTLAIRKSKYGANPYKLNEEHFGNILYNGFKGLYQPLEKGPITVKPIKRIDDIKSYFKNRQNAYSTLSVSDDLRGAYINDRLVGVIGATSNRAITNIHVDGDYRLRGVAKALLTNLLKDVDCVGITPLGDALDFVKRVSKYSKTLNKGVITLETLNNVQSEKKDISRLQILDSNESALNIVGDQFKDYIIKNYNVADLNVKTAILDDAVVGHIVYDKKDRNIVVVEVDPAYRNNGIGSKLINKVVDYNIWCADVANSGVLFWFGKGVADGYKVYLCNSEKRLNKFAKEKGLDKKAIPKMYLD